MMFAGDMNNKVRIVLIFALLGVLAFQQGCTSPEKMSRPADGRSRATARIRIQGDEAGVMSVVGFATRQDTSTLAAIPDGVVTILLGWNFFRGAILEITGVAADSDAAKKYADSMTKVIVNHFAETNRPAVSLLQSAKVAGGAAAISGLRPVQAPTMAEP